MMDDIVIFGGSEDEHDERMRAVFKRLTDNGVTLNFDKSEFSKSSITHLGHVVTADGIEADPAKVRASLLMWATCDVFLEWPTSLANSHRPCRRLHTR